MKKVIRFVALFYIVAVIFSAWGYSVARYKVFPSSVIEPYLNEIIAFLKGGDSEEKTIAQRLYMHRQEAPPPPEVEVMKVVARIPVKGAPDEGYFRIYNKDFVDNGYLLVSRFSKQFGQVVVELIRISEHRVLHRWIPPINEILEKDGLPLNKDTNSFDGYRVQHPFLFKDGSIAFTSGEGALVCIDANSKIKWITPGVYFHHSIEMGPEGNLYVPLVITPEDEGVHSQNNLREDGFAVVTPDGKIIRKWSMARILIDNGYKGLVLGVGEVEKDRFHLNDAQPMLFDKGIIMAGDIALSMRHLSTVLIFRPSTNEVVALRTGPWLMQHDANQLSDGRLSVFNNENVRPDKMLYSGISACSSVMIWDPATNNVEDPYKGIMEQYKICCGSSGRARMLPNGDFYADVDCLARFSKNEMRWMYANMSLDDKFRGVLHWCRYLLPDEVETFWKTNK